MRQLLALSGRHKASHDVVWGMIERQMAMCSKS